MKKKKLSIILFLLFASCATPHVVNIIGPSDNEMNCEELSSEIAKANQYANEAQKAKKMSSPHNIGALVFFLPAVGVTMKNIDEAMVAAQKRSEHLNKIKDRKKCGQ